MKPPRFWESVRSIPLHWLTFGFAIGVNSDFISGAVSALGCRATFTRNAANCDGTVSQAIECRRTFESIAATDS
jgi:hypothetical protein